MADKKITVYRGARGEYTEKKSRFIADLFYAETPEETEAQLLRVRKEFYDARHHCSASILVPKGGGPLLLRSSDDGEPQGTAGHPMLAVLEGAGLVSVHAVVTRYFGGTLLGTGGLVRSYTKALQDALQKSVLIERLPGIPLTTRLDYGIAGKAEYFIAKEDLAVLQKEYGSDVSLTLLVPEEKLSYVKKELTGMSGGKAPLHTGRQIEYAVLDGQVLTGEQLLSR